jgi:GAF domain-containing protein
VRRRGVHKVVEEDRLGQLIAVGPSPVGELDLEVLLNRLLETACSVTAARYAAPGVLDKERKELERFVTIGVSEEQERAIGERPRGRGVLGVLIRDLRPLKLTDVTTHPHSSGFPPGHPSMRSFLGVPFRDEAFGAIAAFDRETESPEFDENDEQVLAAFAATAATAVGQHRRAEQLG